jgi:ribose 5-phosphate isomerase B
MTIYLGADHGGFALKEHLKALLSAEGHTVTDCGNTELVPDDDYPDFAFAVADRVSADPGARGILVCRSGGGMAVAANKVRGVRAATAFSPAEVAHDRRDDDINVLCLSADFVPAQEAPQYVSTFLTEPFSGGERYVRRLAKIAVREG